MHKKSEIFILEILKKYIPKLVKLNIYIYQSSKYHATEQIRRRTLK